MPIRHYVIGEGMDERSRTKITPSTPPTRAEVHASVEMLRAAGASNDLTVLLGRLERQAEWTMGHACGPRCKGHHEPNEMQRQDAAALVSQAWDGRKGRTGIIDMIRTARAQGDVDFAIALGIKAGALSESLRLRLTWGLDASTGRKSRSQGDQGKKAAHPALRRAEADSWLRANEDEVRRRNRRQTREGIATWALLHMPARRRPGRTVFLEALAALLGNARKR